MKGVVIYAGITTLVVACANLATCAAAPDSSREVVSLKVQFVSVEPVRDAEAAGVPQLTAQRLSQMVCEEKADILACWHIKTRVGNQAIVKSVEEIPDSSLRPMEIGIVLKVTPTILPKRQILLDIDFKETSLEGHVDQESSAETGTPLPNGRPPALKVSAFETKLAVAHGASTVMKVSPTLQGKSESTFLVVEASLPNSHAVKR